MYGNLPDDTTPSIKYKMPTMSSRKISEGWLAGAGQVCPDFFSLSPMRLLQRAMETKKPHYSKDEFAKRGDRIYEDEGKFVLIDIETCAYEIDEDKFAASDRLLARCPTAQVWMAWMGLRAARRYQ